MERLGRSFGSGRLEIGKDFGPGRWKVQKEFWLRKVGKLERVSARED